MLRRLCALFIIASLWIASNAGSVIRQNYGGNLKVAEDLLEGAHSGELFLEENGALKALYPLPFRVEGSTATLDLASLNPDQQTEMEKAVQSLTDLSNPCHWILDYPYLNHHHPTTIAFEENQLTVHTEEPDFLNAILTSSCLAPSKLSFLNPFAETQFGLEANSKCLAGRPFLDSISPVTIDPANPYLSFKLNDVDVFLLPEDRFQQASNDPELKIQNGPRYYLYLKTRNLTPEQVLRLTEALDVKQAAGGVLNEHLEVVLSGDRNSEANVALPPKISFLYPSEFPYRLIGERLSLQCQEAGISVDNKTPTANTPVVELEFAPMEGSDFDVFRYHLLKDRFKVQSDEAWYDEWDKLESSEAIVPLLIHVSRVAVRKNIQDIRSRADGFPDFADCWIFQKP